MSLNEKKIKKSNREVDLGGFKMRDDLNPKIWDGDVMKTDVRKTLLKIADDYFEGLDLDSVDIEDITMTGSLSNYNWSKYSDVDLHIIIDYKDMPMNQVVVEDYLKSKSDAWNDKHDIKVYGFDVEIFVQDAEAEHTSTGVYSVLKDEWNVKPKKKKISINDVSVKNKSNRIMDWIDDLYDIFNETDSKNNTIDDDEEVVLFDLITKKADKIKGKIKKMRQCGLDEGGEFSVENMVFKVLRRNGMLERLGDIKTVAYDKSVTLESISEGDDLDWIRDISSVVPFSVLGTIPEIGDEVICIEGFSNESTEDIPNDEEGYGGSGYVEGKIFVVVETQEHHNRRYKANATAWSDSGQGVFLRALAPYHRSVNESEDDLKWIDDVSTSDDYLEKEFSEWLVDGLVGDDRIFAYYVTAKGTIEEFDRDKLVELRQRILVGGDEPSKVFCEVMTELERVPVDYPLQNKFFRHPYKDIICKDARKKIPLLKRFKNRVFGESEEEDDLKWISDAIQSTIDFFEYGKHYRMGMLFTEGNTDTPYVFYEHKQDGTIDDKYNDDRGTLEFSHGEFSPLFIETKLRDSGLTLEELVIYET